MGVHDRSPRRQSDQQQGAGQTAQPQQQPAGPGNAAAQESMRAGAGGGSDTPTLDAAGLGSDTGRRRRRGGRGPGADTSQDEHAAEREAVSGFVEESPAWIREINTTINPLTREGRLTGIDPALTTIVTNYGVAKRSHERTVARGSRSEQGTRAIMDMALGMLPGLGDVTSIMMPSGAFFAPLNAVRGQAESRTMAPLGGGGSAGAAGESSAAFALRAEQSKTEAFRAVLQVAQTGSNLAEVANDARALLPRLEGDDVSQQDLATARQMADIRRSWPQMQQTIQRLARGVQEAQTSLSDLVGTWSYQQLEIYLWVLWVGGLTDDGAYHLAPDAVERRLNQLGVTGPGSITGADLSGSVDLGGLGGLYINPQQVVAVRQALGWRPAVLRVLETYTPHAMGNPSG